MTRSPNDNTQRPISNPRGRFRFSLGYLVVFTAVIAAWTAAFMARQKNLELQSQQDALLSLSSHLNVVDPDELAKVSLPSIANDWRSWDVHVPDGKPQELRFHCGNVSIGGLPQEFESGPLSPGRHRVVFRASDSAEDLCFYQVYVDGRLVTEKQMGRDWMPKGWRMSNGCSPRESGSAILFLTGRRYLPKGVFGRNEYFNGQLDQSSTELGYQLWIDEVGRSPKPINPFLEFKNWSRQEGVGHRDGLRFIAWSFGKPSTRYHLTFVHPDARRRATVLNVELEFLIDQKVVLSNLTAKFKGWRLSDSVDQLNAPNWKPNSAPQSRTVFLHGCAGELGGLEPVIELRWSEERPDEIGFRLPQVAGNAAITSWRLRCAEGISQLWRIIESGDLEHDSRTIAVKDETDAEPALATIGLADPEGGIQSVRWRTDIEKPLQLYQRNKANSNALAGIKLYDGMPFQFGCEFSESASAKVWAHCADEFPDGLNTPIVGGIVFEEIVIEVDNVEPDAANPAWVWLRAQPR